MLNEDLITIEANYQELNDLLKKTFELMSFHDLIRYGVPFGYYKIAPKLVEYCNKNKIDYNDDFRNFYSTKTLVIENKLKKRKYDNFSSKAPKDTFRLKIIFENPSFIDTETYTSNNNLKSVLQQNKFVVDHYLKNQFNSTFTVLNYNDGIAIHIKKGESKIGFRDYMVKSTSIFIIPTNVNCMSDFLDFIASVLDYNYSGNSFDYIIYPTEVFGNSLLNFVSILSDYRTKYYKDQYQTIYNKYGWKSYYLHHQTKEYNIVEVVNGYDKEYLAQSIVDKYKFWDNDDNDNDFREDYRRANNDAYEIDSNEYDGWYEPID